MGIRAGWLTRLPEIHAALIAKTTLNAELVFQTSPAPLNVGTAITINRCTDSWTDWYCNDHALTPVAVTIQSYRL